MDYCHTQSSEKFTQKRVIVELPIKLVLITFNDFFLNYIFFNFVTSAGMAKTYSTTNALHITSERLRSYRAPN